MTALPRPYRALAVVLLAYPTFIVLALAETALMIPATVTLGVVWVLLAGWSIWSARPVAVLALLALSAFFGAIAVAVLFDRPCDLRFFDEDVKDFEGDHWDWWLPPADSCRVEKLGGDVVYERPWLGAFTPSLAWALLTAWLIVASRPSVPWRLAIVVVTWFGTAFLLFSGLIY